MIGTKRYEYAAFIPGLVLPSTPAPSSGPIKSDGLVTAVIQDAILVNGIVTAAFAVTIAPYDLTQFNEIKSLYVTFVSPVAPVPADAGDIVAAGPTRGQIDTAGQLGGFQGVVRVIGVPPGTYDALVLAEFEGPPQVLKVNPNNPVRRPF